nr:membrane protein insertion efficiency factor YidD [Deferribacter autotrophicus]
MLNKFFKKLIIRLIDIYQVLLSPFLGRNCRFYPTCSQYTKEAIIKKGLIVGMILSCWRILRCNPFSKGGYDPVE